jgi:hypothetical protein
MYYQIKVWNNSICTNVLRILCIRILGEHCVSVFIRLQTKYNLLLSICQSVIVNVRTGKDTITYIAGVHKILASVHNTASRKPLCCVFCF